MTELQIKIRLTRLRDRVKTCLAALDCAEMHLEDAQGAISAEALGLDLVEAEGWVVDLLEDVRGLLAEASSLRGELAEETRT